MASLQHHRAQRPTVPEVIDSGINKGPAPVRMVDGLTPKLRFEAKTPSCKPPEMHDLKARDSLLSVRTLSRPRREEPAQCGA